MDINETMVEHWCPFIWQETRGPREARSGDEGLGGPGGTGPPTALSGEMGQDLLGGGVAVTKLQTISVCPKQGKAIYIRPGG